MRCSVWATDRSLGGFIGYDGCQKLDLIADRFRLALLFYEVELMNISLTPELEMAVKKKVESGLYNNASEVIREALRNVLKQEQENEWLKREAAIGYAQLEAGEVTRLNSKEDFKNLVRRQKK